MQEVSKLYFHDAAGKFDAVKQAAHDAFCKRGGKLYDLTIYSLTPMGDSEPARLILKMTPAGNPDGYLSAQRLDVKEASVSMFMLNYRTFPADQLIIACRALATSLLTASQTTYMRIKRYERFPESIAVADFFGMKPREDEPGAQIYLRDKAFFLSRLPDPKNPDFLALPLLTDDQKAEVSAIDMSRADIKGRGSLYGLFRGYKSLRRLDLSAFETTGVSNMSNTFSGCESLQHLDLSAFDFTWVKDMDQMFSSCPNLKEIILSDTILHAGRIPQRRARVHTMEEINDIYRHEYITSGPGPAQMAAELAASDTIYVPFSQATEEEIYRYLGLQYGRQRITIVPHRKKPLP